MLNFCCCKMTGFFNSAFNFLKQFAGGVGGGGQGGGCDQVNHKK